MPNNNEKENSTTKEFPMRLQVYLAKCGIGSRRRCEQHIEAGLVSVNGAVVTTLGTKVGELDSVTYCGKKIALENRKVYILLHKPKGYLCALKDNFDRPVASDLLKEKYSERIYNVGRLDLYSSGAIIFTNDGSFAKNISHPSSEIEKEYLVETVFPFDKKVLDEFKKGKYIDGIFYRCQDAKKLSDKKMSITLIEGKNREIRRVLNDSQIKVRRLIRIRIGNIVLGSLKPGEFRDLTNLEIQELLKLVSKKGN